MAALPHQAATGRIRTSQIRRLSGEMPHDVVCGRAWRLRRGTAGNLAGDDKPDSDDMTLQPEVPGHLSYRERQIVELVADGLTNYEVSAILGISYLVVKNYLRVIYDKTGMFTRLELALWALQHEANQV